MQSKAILKILKKFEEVLVEKAQHCLSCVPYTNCPFFPYKKVGGESGPVWFSSSLQREGERTARKNRLNWILFPRSAFTRKKKNMYISIYRMVKEYTSFAVAQ